MGGGWQCKPLWFWGLIRVVVTQILRQTIDKASCRISFNKAMIPIEKSGHGLLFFHVPFYNFVLQNVDYQTLNGIVIIASLIVVMLVLCSRVI